MKHCYLCFPLSEVLRVINTCDIPHLRGHAEGQSDDYILIFGSYRRKKELDKLNIKLFKEVIDGRDIQSRNRYGVSNFWR